MEHSAKIVQDFLCIHIKHTMESPFVTEDNANVEMKKSKDTGMPPMVPIAKS